MRAKRANNVSVMLGRLLYIGFSVQIVFGIIWMVKNIVYVQMFGEASENLTLSELLRGDGDTGILYPAIVLLTRALGEITFVPWYSYLYIVQLVLAVPAGFCLLREAELFGRKWRRYIWGSLVIMTFPMILQIHMAIMVNSIVLSLLMFQAAFCIRAWKCLKNNKSGTIDYVYAVSGVALFWLLLTLTQWIYIFIAAVPVVITVIGVIIVSAKKTVNAKKNNVGSAGRYGLRRNILSVLMTLVLFLGITLGLDRLTTDYSMSQRATFSVERQMFIRVAWHSRVCYPGLWMYELGSVVGDEVMNATYCHQENVENLMMPMLEQELGREKALEIYRYGNKIAWTENRNDILHDVLVDTAGYVIPPVITSIYLDKGTSISYIARNYDSFKRNAPVFSKYYIDYSMLWFEAALIIGFAIFILQFFSKANRVDKRVAGAYIVMCVVCLLIAVRNVMLGSCMYDYKEAGSAVVAWFMAIFVTCGNAVFDEDVK